jgi:pimeloyl-ACP methyl ester carboxylesterase
VRRPSRPAPTSSTTSRYRLSLLAAAALLLTACGSSHHVSGPPAPKASYCGGLPSGFAATTDWLKTSDGVRLWSATAGSGSTTLVLAHESGGIGLCGWLPAMAYLAKHGVRTLAFNFRGVAPSDVTASTDYEPDLQAAIDAAGTKHVFLMGASMGGAAAMTYGSRLKGLDGLINLSGEQRISNGNLDAIDNVGKLRIPFLVLASNDDGYLTGAQARQLVARAGSSDKKAVVFPGANHGWDLLDARVYATLLGWLRRHSS